jgi:hypothetical protein
MIEVLHFVFDSGPHFVCVSLLTFIVFDGLAGMFRRR